MSLLATFAVMKVLGYSLDNLSLMALTLSVGFVVDDAIVMLENIVRHMEMGKKPMQAALDGSREIGFTILSMTLVAGGGLHSAAVSRRHRRTALPRVLRHHRGVDPGVGVRVAHPHADARQPLPQADAPGRRAQPGGAGDRRFERGYETVARASTSARWPGSWPVVRPPLVFSAPHPGRHRGALADGAQGLHSQRGPGPAARHHRGGGGHLVRGDDAIPAGGDADPRGRRERRRASCRRSGRVAAPRPPTRAGSS